METLMTGIAFGESPRWHEGRLWFSDWGAEELIAVDLAGKVTPVLRETGMMRNELVVLAVSSSVPASDSNAAIAPLTRR